MPRRRPMISTSQAWSARFPCSRSQRDVRENTSSGPVTSRIWTFGNANMAIRLGARFERRDDAGLREARARFGEGIAEGVADGRMERILAACGVGHNDIVPTFSAMAPSGLGGAIPPVGTRRAALVGPYPPVEPLPSNQRDRRGGPPQTLLTPARRPREHLERAGDVQDLD